MKAKLQLVRHGRAVVDLQRLARMRPDELQRLHRDVFGCAVPFSNAEQARRQMAWRIQADREGGLPESARQHALAIARDAALRIRARLGTGNRAPLAHAGVTSIVSDHDPRLPMPGSILVKEYRGKTIRVHVLDAGFEFDGRRFTSLSAIAKEITGTKWNGMVFFGLGKARADGR